MVTPLGKMFIEEVVDYFVRFDNERFDSVEIVKHSTTFMMNYLERDKLGPKYGYTIREALRFQLEEYARHNLNWDDPREGEEDAGF